MAKLVQNKKIGIATIGASIFSDPQKETISDKDIYNLAKSLPILNGILPRMRKGSQLIAQGITKWEGQKVKNKANYLIDAETLSIQFHVNKLRILQKNPNFGFAMMQEYKIAVQRDYNSGIKVKV